MGFFDFLKKGTSYKSHYKFYKYDTLEQIESIPVPTEPFNTNFDFKESVEYVLQRKATEHKRNGRLDLAIACLKKSNEIMPYAHTLYTNNDYLRLVKYLRLAKRFDEARIEEEKILGYCTETKKEINSSIIQRSEEVSSELNDNPIILVSRGYRICSECAKYHDRLYSLNGTDSRLPDFKLYKNYTASKTCDCSLTSFPFVLGISIMRGLGSDDPISYSNRPFSDDRNPDEIKEYDEYIAKISEENKNRTDYYWICENLPDLAPKSLSGYMRMKNSNSKNYEKLVNAASAKDYII